MLPGATNNCCVQRKRPSSPFPSPTAKASFLAPDTLHNKWIFSNRLLRPRVQLGCEARCVDWTSERDAPKIPAFPPRWHDSAGLPPGVEASVLTTLNASGLANSLESNTRVNRISTFARRGLIWRSRYRAHCLRRKKISAPRAHRGRRRTLMNLRVSSDRSNVVTSTLDRESSFGINARIAHLAHRRHWEGRSEAYRIAMECSSPGIIRKYASTNR